MRWKSINFIHEFGGIFLPKSQSNSAHKQNSVQAIKDAMLKELGDKALEKFPLTQLRITHADNAQDLWYLRGDVMTAISSLDGEAVAHNKITGINKMFSGLVPKNLLIKTNRRTYQTLKS